MITPNELRKRAIEFSREHADDADEKSQAQNYWRDFFAIWGLSPQRIGAFESRARTLRGTVGFIDFFWPGMLLIEHKSRGKDLDAALKQALDYCTSGGLKDTELPRFIVVSDFARIRVQELAAKADGTRIDAEFTLDQLHERLHLFNFILGIEQRSYADEDPVNIEAAELMGALHDTLKANGYEGHPLELFLVRLMFCFFADDTGIFPKDQFAFIMEEKAHEDGSDTGLWIAQAFQTINTDPERRMRNLDEALAALPYVNGGLFEEVLPVPQFDRAMRGVFLHCCLFDWSRVSPAVFGSLFQSVMDAKARRNLGAHYTSEKNILKTIHGLFLDELREEYEKARGSAPRLRQLLGRIKAIRLLDPACGCGNFLILSYRELRLLEMDAHREIQRIEKQKYMDLDLYRGIAVDHLYGIEIEEFPAQIARTALWIMDHLMNVRLSEEFGEYIVRLPLTHSPHVVHGNALRLDWKDIVRPEELTYILGNPPFVGAKWMNDDQRNDMAIVAGNGQNFGLLDFVCAWYIKASEYIAGTTIRCAFVSTNSISQGEQVSALWNILYPRGVRIHFAHRTFKWTNEAKGVAAVHCIIIGFGIGTVPRKLIFEYPSITGEPQCIPANNINPYLVDATDTWIGRREQPLCAVPPMVSGNKPIDDGNYLFTPEEKTAFICLEPRSEPFFKRWLGGEEFINNIERWCLYLAKCPPEVLRSMPEVLKRVEAVKRFREASKSEPTRRIAATPTLFHTTFYSESNYIAMPQVSSERRVFIPIAWLDGNYLCGDKLRLIVNADRFIYGILNSTMHMAWTRQVCGRLKSDYQYSALIVYNNFPWPRCTPPWPSTDADPPPDSRVATVEKAAQGVLDARARYPDSSLADLYDPLTMPPDLVKAHKTLDAAVDACYRKEPFRTELERVEFLFGLYEEYTAAEAGGKGRG